jgi:hypothetical protein
MSTLELAGTSNKKMKRGTLNDSLYSTKNNGKSSGGMDFSRMAAA